MSLEITGGAVAQAPSGIDPLKIPAGIDPTAFRSILAAFTTAYRVLGRTPSADEVHSYWPKVSAPGIAEILLAPEFRDALAKRGIELGDTPGLTHVQHLALMAVSDPYDKRSLKQKLEAAGVTTQQYANWQRQPLFVAARRAMASKMWDDGLDDVKTRMFQQAEAGSFQHQEFILETLGEGPKAREAVNAQAIVQGFVSAISRATVGHPEIREAILSEMRSEMAMIQMAQVAAAR